MNIQIYIVGNEDCNHDKWVYKTLSMMNFIFPPTYVQQRICPKCGRVEVVTDSQEYLNESELYNEIYSKFSNKFSKTE